MKLLRSIAGISLLTCIVLPALADKCKDPIVDEMSAITSSERAQIETSMATLTQKGADVRVHVVDSFHRNAANAMNKSLDEYKSTMKAKCVSWQAPNGGMKNNLILVIVAPKERASLVANGDQWQSAIEPIRSRIYDTTMNPRFREGKIGGAIAKALEDVVDVTSIKASQVGKPVTINHATDYSGVTSFFKWLLFVLALGGIGYAGYWFYRQYEGRRNAQRNAQTALGQCTQSINSFDGTVAILTAKIAKSEITPEWKIRLRGLLDQGSSEYQSVSQEFSGLNRGANNPDTPRLSVEEYAGMERRYSELATKFSRAERLLSGVESEFRRAQNKEPIIPETLPSPAKAAAPREVRPSKDDSRRSSGRTERQGTRPISTPPPVATPSAHQSAPASSPAQPAQGDRVVVVHDHGSGSDFLTGVLVGDALSHNRDHGHERRDDYTPSYRRNRGDNSDPVIATPSFDTPRPSAPAPSSEGRGTSRSWGESSEGGGRSQGFGQSSEGGGASQGFSGGSSRSGTQY